MGWLLLWSGIGLLFLAMLAASGWRLWRKARALWQELAAQGRTLGEMVDLLGRMGELELRPDAARREPPPRS